MQSFHFLAVVEIVVFELSVPTMGDDAEGKTIGYVYCDATLTGIFTLSDACRTGVVEAIKELKSLGIKTAMLTGDSHASAMHAQDQVHLLPEKNHQNITVKSRSDKLTRQQKMYLMCS